MLPSVGKYISIFEIFDIFENLLFSLCIAYVNVFLLQRDFQLESWLSILVNYFRAKNQILDVQVLPLWQYWVNNHWIFPSYFICLLG